MAKSFAYDHPAYTVPQIVNMGELAAGANANKVRFVAWAAMIVKSVSFMVTVAGTATTHIYTIYKQSGTTSTSIGAVTLTTNTNGYATNVNMSNAAIAAGEAMFISSGADATGAAAATAEVILSPGTDVSS